jgi:hypothetical protein
MGLTLEGRDFITGAIVNLDPNTAATPTFFIEANSAIGVGSSSTAFVNTQTDLQATTYGTNKIKKAMDSGYPSIVGNVLTFRSTFGLSDANFAWEEWGVFNFTAETVPSAPAGQYMLNRKAESLGTKTSAQTWELTVELTITAA